MAISASLLPPAVNCGLLWAVALEHLTLPGRPAFYGDTAHGFHHDSDSLLLGWDDIEAERNATEHFDNSTGVRYIVLPDGTGYPLVYSENISMEAFYLGLFSLILTLINILCIIITGVLILKLKEVTPEKVPQKFSHFWRTDVKAHRDYYKAIRKGDAKAGGSDKEAALEQGQGENMLQSMWERAEADQDVINIRHWVNMPSATRYTEHSHYQYHIKRCTFLSAIYNFRERSGTQSRHLGRQSSKDPWSQPLLGEGKFGARALTLDSQAEYAPVYEPAPAPPQFRARGGTVAGRHFARQPTLAAPNAEAYLNIPEFLNQELNRSREVRRQLKQHRKTFF